MTQDQYFAEKPYVAPLMIKIPAQSVESKLQSSSSTLVREPDNNVEGEEDEEDEDGDDDDWDTFQSFPASSTEAAPTSTATEEPNLTGNASMSNHDFEQHPTPPSSDEAIVITVAKEEAEDTKSISDSVIDKNETKEIHDFPYDDQDTEQCDVVIQQENNEVVSSQANIQTSINHVEVEETCSEPSDIEENRMTLLNSQKNQSSSDVQHIEECSDPVKDHKDSTAAGPNNEKEMESSDLYRMAPDSEKNQTSSDVQHVEEYSDADKEHHGSTAAAGF